MYFAQPLLRGNRVNKGPVENFIVSVIYTLQGFAFCLTLRWVSKPKASSEIYLRYHFHRYHNHSMLYHLRNMHRSHNMHLYHRRPALVRNDSCPRGFLNLFWTPLLLPCLWKPHVSVTKNPKGGPIAHRLPPSLQDQVYGMSVQHGLCFQRPYLDVLWLPLLYLLFKIISSFLRDTESQTYGISFVQFDSERVFSLQGR